MIQWAFRTASSRLRRPSASSEIPRMHPSRKRLLQSQVSLRQREIAWNCCAFLTKKDMVEAASVFDFKRQRTSTYNEFLWIPLFPAMSPLQWVSLFRKPIDVPMFLQDEVNCVGAAVTASLCPLSHELIPWDFTVRPKPPHPRARYSGSTQVIFGSGKLKSTCGSCEEYIYIYIYHLNEVK